LCENKHACEIVKLYLQTSYVRVALLSGAQVTRRPSIWCWILFPCFLGAMGCFLGNSALYQHPEDFLAAACFTYVRQVSSQSLRRNP